MIANTFITFYLLTSLWDKSSELDNSVPLHIFLEEGKKIQPSMYANCQVFVNSFPVGSTSWTSHDQSVLFCLFVFARYVFLCILWRSKAFAICCGVCCDPWCFLNVQTLAIQSRVCSNLVTVVCFMNTGTFVMHLDLYRHMVFNAQISINRTLV